MKIFWSYAQLDDQTGRVAALRKAFETSLSQAQGKPCKVYCDKLDLKWGAVWMKGIEKLVRKSDGFVAIVSPSYFNSRMCLYELDLALNARKEIRPIYYRQCKVLKSSFKENGVDAAINKRLNQASTVLKKLQMKDFRKLKNEQLDSKDVQDFLDELADQIG